jgi:hypothetical protein
VEHWCAARNRPIGAIISLPDAWALAVAWYTGRLELDWRRRTADEAQAVFTSIGLVGPFWRLS